MMDKHHYTEWLTNIEDEELEFYKDIELYFARKGGFPWILRGRDWMIARDWYEKGIPLEVIFQAMDDVFAKRMFQGNNPYLSIVDRQVRRLWKQHALSLVDSLSEEHGLPGFEEVRVWFENWKKKLEKGIERAREQGFSDVAPVLEKALRKLERIEMIENDFTQADANFYKTLQKKLENFQTQLMRDVKKNISNETLEDIRQSIMNELPGSQKELPAHILNDLIKKRIRALFGLPEFSVLTHIIRLMNPENEGV